jgi:hypothetical protein
VRGHSQGKVQGLFGALPPAKEGLWLRKLRRCDVTVAEKAGLLQDSDVATERMRRVLAVAGVS